MRKDAVNRIRSSLEDLLRDRRNILKILSILLILAIAVIFRVHGADTSDITVEVSDGASRSEGMFVDIGGAVVSPGVYEVSSGTRLYEVIDMAGGLTSDADTVSINRASFVEDGQKIIIPVSAVDQDDGSMSASAGDAVDAGTSSAYASGQNAGTASYTGMININTASLEELKTLSGIGDVIAERIIEYRSSGSFRSIEEIRNVKGIGESVYNKIKDSITV